jgi:hypothetical protein
MEIHLETEAMNIEKGLKRLLTSGNQLFYFNLRFKGIAIKIDINIC